MILWLAWKHGLMRSLDLEKLRFFFGYTRGEFAISRRRPLVRGVRWIRAILSPAYARAVITWLSYRVELYDGAQG